MSGFWALDFMNKTLKNNRGLVKKINVFDRIKPYSSALKESEINVVNKSTPESLAAIRARTLAEGRRNTIFQILKMGMVLVIIGVVLVVLIGGVLLGKS